MTTKKKTKVKAIPQPHGGALTPFPKGTSGNLKGKPKGTKHLSTWIQELMNDPKFELHVLDSKGYGYKTYKGAPIKAIIEVAIRKALGGDKAWADWLAVHGYGTKITIERDDPIEALLTAYGVIKALDDGQATEALDRPPKSKT